MGQGSGGTLHCPCGAGLHDRRTLPLRPKTCEAHERWGNRESDGCYAGSAQPSRWTQAGLRTDLKLVHPARACCRQPMCQTLQPDLKFSKRWLDEERIPFTKLREFQEYLGVGLLR